MNAGTGRGLLIILVHAMTEDGLLTTRVAPAHAHAPAPAPAPAPPPAQAAAVPAASAVHFNEALPHFRPAALLGSIMQRVK